jgi:hypothetical protein
MIGNMWTAVRKHWIVSLVVLVLLAGIVCAQSTSEAWLTPVATATPLPGGGKNLIVLVPAFMMTSQSLGSLLGSLQRVRPDADLLRIDYPAHLTSNANPYQIADHINSLIEKALYDKKIRPYYSNRPQHGGATGTESVRIWLRGRIRFTRPVGIQQKTK